VIKSNEIWVAQCYVDFRCSIDGLCGHIQEYFSTNPQKSSEKTSSIQEEIIFNADDTLTSQSVSADEALNETIASTEEIETITYTRCKKNGRNIDTSKLPRVQHMWVFLSPLINHKLIRFRFDLTRSGNVVNEELKGYSGLLQNDGYSGYNSVRAQTSIIAFGCFAHSRRKFAEVVKTGSKKTLGKAGEALEYFAKLYLIEETARIQKQDYEQRKLLRQTEAMPILEQFHQWLIDTNKLVPPGSAIGKAIDYTLSQWSYLIGYCQYGEVEIDTNHVENQIRPFALGRANWLFLMHEESARIAALYYSLIQSAKLNKLNPRIYLHYLLTQVHALRKKTVNPVELLPHRINPDILTQFAEKEIQKAQSIYNSAQHVVSAWTKTFQSQCNQRFQRNCRLRRSNMYILKTV
jgi:hypothetical protein